MMAKPVAAPPLDPQIHSRRTLPAEARDLNATEPGVMLSLRGEIGTTEFWSRLGRASQMWRVEDAERGGNEEGYRRVTLG
jgi:hypothetical protein